MLQKIGFQPGINKQISATTAEGQWIDCDNVRFRYSTPEKIGGWKQLGTWGGEEPGATTTTLNGAINDSTTTIVLTDASQFPSTGTNFIKIGTEEMSYTGITSNTLTGVTRGVRNTTAASHSDGATVTDTSDFVAWGEAASGDLVVVVFMGCMS